MLDLYYFPDNACLAPHLLLAETNADYSLKLHIPGARPLDAGAHHIFEDMGGLINEIKKYS